MSLVVREASFPADADAMQSVWSWVYGLKAPTEPLDPPAEGEKWYIGLDEGVPAVACKVHGYAVARGDADLSCGGVASVATLSEHRQKGHGTRFMDEVLPLMRAHGHVISSLYAFRDPFYARSGYGTCGWRWKIVCPAHRMPKTKCDLPVRQVMPADVECLSGALTKFVRGFSGSVVRTPQQWQNRLGTKPPLIYAVGDPIEAYAWVRITDFWGNVDVGELVWTTPADTTPSSPSCEASATTRRPSRSWSRPTAASSRRTSTRASKCPSTARRCTASSTSPRPCKPSSRRPPESSRSA